jgi:hypothetical protein
MVSRVIGATWLLLEISLRRQPFRTIAGNL